ncbi:ABC transporter permease [Pelolinea submarina]|uniref:ABC-2 type transport system permease protein n=1 Tax=Pelolinea submarina TaxID=913107 RepID=A0A347ZUV8_9CHLR|nr:ABC transporter permease [Pelolinea submarina]REG10327.1 ABC-2 type transport system permease protein [Pelolinea submarina]BBB49089.1 lantibiotic transport system permease protein [Pelolinea submarina]
MFSRTFRAERIKLHHNPVWLAFLCLPIIPAVLGTFNYFQNIEILQDKWYSLWSQQTLFSCFFFLPALIGVYSSYLYRLEHLNHNWNTIMTMPIPVSQFVLSKLLSATLMVILTQAWTGVLFILSGKLVGINAPLPPELLNWLFYGAIGGIAICAVQLAISLVIRSFAVPVGIALMGGISGLVASAKGFGVWNPYALLSLGMQANKSGGTMQCSQSLFLLNSLVFVTISVVFSVLWLKKRDVLTT